MKKILLALTLLAAGGGAFHSARQYASQLQQKVWAANESWQIHTQQLAVVQSEQAALTERVRELKQTLAQSQPASGNALWSALQTNRADRLPPELRQRALAELGFDWRSSPDFIVVSKQTVRDLQMQVIRGGKLTDVATTVLALTSAERGQVEAAMQRVPTDLDNWARAHVERTEPKDDVVAHYTLPGDPAMSRSISNNFATAVSDALGRERTDLILPSARNWMSNIGLGGNPATLIVKRVIAGNEQQLKADISEPSGFGSSHLMPSPYFPAAFRPIFPNGWPDVAKREGFELPQESQKK